MTNCKRTGLVIALLAAAGFVPLAAAHGTMRSEAPALSESQMQSLASESPTYHHDGTIYDSTGSAQRNAALPPARDGILLPDDATNTMTPAESSRITGHADSAAGPPMTGSEEQAGNMGPNSSKGQ
jgi:hypothetical protein